MATEKLKSASTVLSEFLGDQLKDEDLDLASVSAIVSLRKEGKLTKNSLLRLLEEARKAISEDGMAAGD